MQFFSRKMATKKSKIPVKSFEPLFKIVSDLEKDGSSSKGKRSKSSRKDSKLRAYSAADLTDRGQSLEVSQVIAKIRELQDTVGISSSIKTRFIQIL